MAVPIALIGLCSVTSRRPRIKASVGPQHPRDEPGARRLELAALGALSLVMAGLEALVGRGMRQHGGIGIVGFELAGTRRRSGEILRLWGPVGRAAARRSLMVDFPFIVSYSIFLAVGCTAARDRLAKRQWAALAQLGRPLVCAQLATGSLDAVENVALLTILGGGARDPWPRVARLCARTKFALLSVSIAYLTLAVALPERNPRTQRRGRSEGHQ